MIDNQIGGSRSRQILFCPCIPFQPSAHQSCRHGQLKVLDIQLADRVVRTPRLEHDTYGSVCKLQCPSERLLPATRNPIRSHQYIGQPCSRRQRIGSMTVRRSHRRRTKPHHHHPGVISRIIRFRIIGCIGVITDPPCRSGGFIRRAQCPRTEIRLFPEQQ